MKNHMYTLSAARLNMRYSSPGAAFTHTLILSLRVSGLCTMESPATGCHSNNVSRQVEQLALHT